MKIIMTAMAALATLCSYGQKVNKKDVPPVVRTTFTQQFAQAKNIKWEKENEKTFEASFVMGKREYSTLIDDSGKWIETEIEIAKNDLPNAVLESIRKEFIGFEIEEVEQLENIGHDKIYEVELEKGELTYEVEFRENGAIIKKETAESNERD